MTGVLNHKIAWLQIAVNVATSVQIANSSNHFRKIKHSFFFRNRPTIVTLLS